jgi:TPR repeat protein
MRQSWRAVVVFVILATGFFAPAVAADPFDEALNAYTAGDFTTALKAMARLGQAGDIRAQYMMGRMYSEGEGVERDDALAARWYRVAAERGDVVSQLSLGTLYVNGRGVPADFVAAYKWLTLVARSGRRTTISQALEVRDLIEQLMTAEQIAEAERLAAAWRSK